MGGICAFLAACRTDVRSVVSFYGGGIVAQRPNIGFSPLIDEVEKIRAPMLMFFGERDQGIPLEQVDRIRKTLDAHVKPNAVVVVPGAGHGFFCEQRASYHAEGAKIVWPHTIEWLRATMT